MKVIPSTQASKVELAFRVAGATTLQVAGYSTASVMVDGVFCFVLFCFE